MDFKIGDSIKVNDGVLDPDSGSDISGFQGRVTEIAPPFIVFAWDSISLINTGQEQIDSYAAEGLDWKVMVLEPEDISLADERDTLKDVQEVVDEMSRYHDYLLLDNGVQVHKLLHGIEPENTLELEQRWYQHLEEVLRLPVKAEVFHGRSRGPFCMGSKVTILELDDIDLDNGIMVRVDSKEDGEAYFPLCNLEVVNSKLKNYTHIFNYADWFTNARAS